METVSLTDGILLDEDTLRVRAAVLDHRIPCLAFALEEKAHVNVWKARLDERPFRVWWREGATVIEKQVPLGHLKERLLSVTPGQKIGYVVDAVYHEENARRIVDLVRGADLLFIETPFLQEDLAVAAQKAHLTAHQAGLLAREAGVKRLHPFHFSPRYLDREERLWQEARAALAS